MAASWAVRRPATITSSACSSPAPKPISNMLPSATRAHPTAPPIIRVDSGGYFGTIRARAGVAFDRALVLRHRRLCLWRYRRQPAATTRFSAYHSGDEINWGWTIGGGVEYAITNNFTAKVEGLYVDIDTKDNYDRGGRVNIDRDAEFGVLRAGVNYKFN